MDHQEAVRHQSVERYMLGELTSVQQDEFEAHLFTCPQCSEELRAAAILVDNARTVFRAETVRPSGDGAAVARHHAGGDAPGFFGRLAKWVGQPAWAPVAAAVLLAVAGYQNFVQIPGLRGELDAIQAPRAVPAFALLPVTRGDDQIVSVPAGVRTFVVSFDITEPSQDGYLCVFTDEGGREWLKLEEKPAAGTEMITLQLDPAKIPAGRHLLTVRTRAGEEISRYRFHFKPR